MGRYAIWLNKRELQELRAAINTARDSCGYTLNPSFQGGGTL